MELDRSSLLDGMQGITPWLLVVGCTPVLHSVLQTADHCVLKTKHSHLAAKDPLRLKFR